MMNAVQRMKRRLCRYEIALLICATLSTAVFLGRSVPVQAATDSLIPVGARKVAPDFKLTDLKGRTLELSQYRGKIVLLDFWAVDCGGCKIELPWYVAFDAKYRSKGLSLIGLDMYGEKPEVVRPFMAKWHMDYPVAIGSDAIGSSFGLREMPLTLLIDRRGKIAVSHAGIVDKDNFEELIQQLLREK
jgi:peroxiredoxin